MKTTLVSVDEWGNGYCVITRDDGSSFGQQFAGFPVDDPAAFKSHIDKLAVEAVVRTTPPKPRTKDPAVVAIIGVETVVDVAALGVQALPD